MCIEEIENFCVNHFLIIMVWFFLFVIASCLIFKSWLAKRFMISCNEAIKLINKENATVVDLRNCDDYCKGHIIRSVNLSGIDIKNGTCCDFIKKDSLLIIVCTTGLASYSLVKSLNKDGFERVYFLQDGINGWLRNNLPLVSNG